MTQAPEKCIIKTVICGAGAFAVRGHSFTKVRREIMDERADIRPVAYVDASADMAFAGTLAEKLAVRVVTGEPEGGTFLRLDADGLSLVGDGLTMRGDFTKMLPRLKRRNLNGELLVRAAAIKYADKTPTLVDATAGMGEDSLLLAASGFGVTLYEYDPVIAALLRDTMRRAADIPELAAAVGRMSLVASDSVSALNELSVPPDVVYLDPMFPQKQKSALVKKKFQLLHTLERPCPNEDELLNAAVAAGPRKIVIKRPAKGPFLAGVKPSYSIEGNGIRFDCIVIPRAE